MAEYTPRGELHFFGANIYQACTIVSSTAILMNASGADSILEVTRKTRYTIPINLSY